MLGHLKRFNTIGQLEADNVDFLIGQKMDLSGYLAGHERGGYWVQRLEELWAHVFRVKHAIACNSCTSGLLAACAVSGVTRDSNVVVPAITMSATAAAPASLGASIVFGDIDPSFYCLERSSLDREGLRAVIVTNLFGHPGALIELRKECDEKGITLIEDNAQAILAMENGQYTGTISHIGCFSLNIHKHIQCGEGGVLCTNDEEIAYKLRGFINHGENMGLQVGLNLRMPELCAAVALAQLQRAPEIVGNRIEQAEKLISATMGAPGVEIPKTRAQCTHSYYHVAWKVSPDLYYKLLDTGVFRRYVRPLYHINLTDTDSGNFNPLADDKVYFNDLCPVAEELFGGFGNPRVIIFENCAWDLTDEQIDKIGELFHDRSASPA